MSRRPLAALLAGALRAFADVAPPGGRARHERVR